MKAKRCIQAVLLVAIALTITIGCASTPGEEELVEVKQPAKVAAAEKPAPAKPMEWIARVADAEVMVGSATASIPKAYDPFELLLKVPEKDIFELILLEPGADPKLLLVGESTLKPDPEGKIAFHIIEIDEGNVQPIFDVLGLRVLSKDRLRDAYFLFGELKKQGVSMLKAYDMGRAVTMKFIAQ